MNKLATDADDLFIIVVLGGVFYYLSVYYIIYRVYLELVRPFSFNIIFNIHSCIKEYRRLKRQEPVLIARNRHLEIAFVATALGISGLIITIRSHVSGDFARTGALIAIIGFVSSFYGYWHEDAIHGGLSKGSPPVQVIDIQRAEIRRAQFLSLKAAFFITTVGTLIWAYGDLSIDNVFLPLYKAVTAKEQGEIKQDKVERPDVRLYIESLAVGSSYDEPTWPNVVLGPIWASQGR